MLSPQQSDCVSVIAAQSTPPADALFALSGARPNQAGFFFLTNAGRTTMRLSRFCNRMRIPKNTLVHICSITRKPARFHYFPATMTDTHPEIFIFSVFNRKYRINLQSD